MKKLLSFISILAFATGLYAEDGKAVTLTGTGVCAKCNLGSAESCTNVLQVTNKKGGVVNYVFAKNVEHGKYFCKNATAGLTVKGTCVKKDGVLVLTASSVEKKES